MSESKVGERLNWLRGRRVQVRVTYAETGQLGAETFEATYEDCLPLGREYFFCFNTEEGRRLFRTTAVVEVRERPTQP